MVKITRGTAKVPTYLHHRPSNRSYCWIYEGTKRRQIYLGAWESAESYRRFAEIKDQVLQELPPPEEPEPGEGVTVAELVARFLVHAGEYYQTVAGEITSEFRSFKVALGGTSSRLSKAKEGSLLKLFGDESTTAFTPD